MKIKKGSVWKMNDLDDDQPKYVVVKTLLGLVWYRTVGVKEDPSCRTREEFVKHFSPQSGFVELVMLLAIIGASMVFNTWISYGDTLPEVPYGGYVPVIQPLE